MNKKKRCLSAIPPHALEGKKVILRIDANVPVKGKKIMNDYRLKAVLPTITFLKKHSAQIIIISHLGRPKGKAVSGLSLQIVRSWLEKKLKQKIGFVKNLRTLRIPNQNIVLLENIRFHPGEEKNNKTFCRALASLGDIYVNDAFSVCHREHASVVGIPKLLPSFAGFLLEQEIKVLDQMKICPKKPFICVLGGGKPETKISVMKQLIKKADRILIGGLNVYPFFISAGIITKKQSPIAIKPAMQKEVDSIWEKHKRKIVLPVDGIFEINKKYKTMTTAAFSSVKTVEMLDIGKKTLRLFQIHIKNAGCVYWNGPVGRYEYPKLAKGSKALAKMIALNGQGLIGGGDTVDVVGSLHNKMKYISTGGGASLLYLSGKILPGIKVL